MFLVFVSEPALDHDGIGASFCVGITTIRCKSMAEAVSLSTRLRAALQDRARRGGRARRARPRPELSLLSSAIAEWIDELVEQGFSLDCRRSTLPSSLPQADDAHEVRRDAWRAAAE